MTKIYPNKQMIYAFWLFNSWNKDKGYINSYAYEKSKIEWNTIKAVRSKDEDVRCKISASLKKLWKDSLYRKSQTEKIGQSYGVFSAKRQAALERAQAVARDKCSKKIMCVETNEVFKSLGEAAKMKKTYRSNISKCLHGERPVAGGFHWRFLDEEKTDI